MALLTVTLDLPCLCCHPLRASILEMRKDHEHQLQRLKMLKDQEIDAVTSATSHTRYVCYLVLLAQGIDWAWCPGRAQDEMP